MYKCDNCDETYVKSVELVREFPNIADLGQRLDPGDTVPAGECNECGALVFPTGPGKRDLAERLAEVGVCSGCLKEYAHDVTEPFAHCDCGTAEWAGELPELFRLRTQLAQLTASLTEVVRMYDLDGDASPQEVETEMCIARERLQEGS